MYIDIDRAIEALKGCTNEADRQLAKWLEDYKQIKMLVPIEQALNNEYNKAIDNVESEFLKCENVHYNLQDILNVLNKVKAGASNGNNS